MKATGWIKIHRSLSSHWITNKPEYLAAWILILIHVNHAKEKVLISGSLLDCDRGQSLKSLDSWAHIFGHGWTKQKVRTFFKLLESDQMINTQNERKTTRLTVCKYDSYQSREHANDTQNNTPTTQAQHADNTSLTPNKNDKNDKNDKEVHMGVANSLKLLGKIFIEIFHKTSPNLAEHNRILKMFDSESAEKALQWFIDNPDQRQFYPISSATKFEASIASLIAKSESGAGKGSTAPAYGVFDGNTKPIMSDSMIAQLKELNNADH